MGGQKKDTPIIRRCLKKSAPSSFQLKGDIMQNNPVGWFEIYVQDMTRAKTFYETVFKTKLENATSPEWEMWMFPHAMDKSGAGGALVKMPGFPSGGEQHGGVFQLCGLRGRGRPGETKRRANI
jgi:hypothetical protein